MTYENIVKTFNHSLSYSAQGLDIFSNSLLLVLVFFSLSTVSLLKVF